MKMKNKFLEQINELDQYEAVETGEPCYALSDILKVIEKNELENVEIKAGVRAPFVFRSDESERIFVF